MSSHPLNQRPWAVQLADPCLNVLVLPSTSAAAALPVPPPGSVSRPAVDRPAVVLVQPHSQSDHHADYADALHQGAVGLLDLTSGPSEMIAVVRCAARGQTVLPQPVAQRLAAWRRGARPELTEQQREWLRQLAQGATTRGLARHAGHSERAMYRLLADVYAQLGAANRTQALLAAQRFGLLAPDLAAELAPHLVRTLAPNCSCAVSQ